jgi:hypothetical protein
MFRLNGRIYLPFLKSSLMYQTFKALHYWWVPSEDSQLIRLYLGLKAVT